MKSILFDTEMVKAILDSRKTQTRRAIVDKDLIDTLLKNGSSKTYEAFVRFSKYQVDDILYVKETFLNCIIDNKETILFKADGHTEKDGSELDIPWSPSVHMKKKNARLFLKVTNVRVERLQDITYEDILKEGCPYTSIEDALEVKAIGVKGKAFEWWINLWNSTAKDGYKYEDNPPVFVYEFERVEK